MTVERVEQPFINHFLDAFIVTRKGLVKGIKAGRHLASLAEWGLSFSESTQGASKFAGKTAKEMKYISRALRLCNVFDDIVVPEEPKKDVDLGLYVTEKAGFGVSDLSLNLVFFDEAGLISLGDSAKVVANIGDGFALGAFSSVLVRGSLEHAAKSEELRLDRAALESVEAMLSDPQENKSAILRLQMEKTRLEQRIARAEACQEHCVLDVLEAIFEIASIIFGFVASAAALPFIAAAPVISLLGGAAAGTSLWKLWVDTAKELQPSPVIDQEAVHDVDEGGVCDYPEQFALLPVATHIHH